MSLHAYNCSKETNARMSFSWTHLLLDQYDLILANNEIFTN